MVVAAVIVLVIALAAVFFLLRDHVMVMGALIGILAIGLILIVGYLSSWLHLASVYAVASYKKQTGIKEAYQKTRGLILSYIWVSLLLMPLLIFGFIFFFIPGIIFSIWFSFVGYILVVEHKKGLNALLRSREYARGRFWAIFGRMLFMSLPSIILGLLPYVLFPDQQHIPPLYSLFSTIANILLVPFTMIYSYLIYEKVVAAKGEFTYTSATRQRAMYIVMIVLGWILPVLFFIFIAYASSRWANDNRNDSPSPKQPTRLRTIESENDMQRYSQLVRYNPAWKYIKKCINNIPKNFPSSFKKQNYPPHDSRIRQPELISPMKKNPTEKIILFVQT